MITNSGKKVITKYMLGQAPTFATHIAVGVGPLASSSASYEDIEFKKSLDFEVFRVPILSRGIVKENNQEKIVFKAQMPNDQRYKITELGLYPGFNNVVAGRYDSKILITFSPGESWTFGDNNSSSAVPYPNIPIDLENTSASINSSTPDFVFINSDSTIFDNPSRKQKQEPPRFLNRSLLVNGTTSYIDSSFVSSSASLYLQNSNVNIDLSQNLPDDEIKLACSIVGRFANDNNTVQDVRIILEFVNNISNINTLPPKARSIFSINSETVGTNRYLIFTKKLSEFIKDANFSWANINLINIYVSLSDDEVLNNDYFILLDGIKIDNVTAANPLYSLIAYNIIQTNDQQPVTKKENTNNFIEYRFGVDVT